MMCTMLVGRPGNELETAISEIGSNASTHKHQVSETSSHGASSYSRRAGACATAVVNEYHVLNSGLSAT